jgi:hypothetical protein
MERVDEGGWNERSGVDGRGEGEGMGEEVGGLVVGR